MEHPHSLVRLAVAITASLSLLTACSSSDATAPATPTAISAVAGSDAQIGTVGQALANPISVSVLAANGTPVAGVMVSWAVQSGGGSISITSSPTDSLGNASVSWTLGTVAGADSLTATVGGLSAITISATANAGAPVALVKVSGDGQTVSAGSSTSFIVKAVDTYGNAVSGVTVAWIPENGGELSASTTVTGTDGLAQTLFTADQSITYQVMAELQSDSSVQAIFTATGD